jgi:hypothetical protein
MSRKDESDEKRRFVVATGKQGRTGMTSRDLHRALKNLITVSLPVRNLNETLIAKG